MERKKHMERNKPMEPKGLNTAGTALAFPKRRII